MSLSTFGLIRSGISIFGTVFLVVVMHAFHVITLVPTARESVSCFGSLALPEIAQEGVQSVVVESMGFPLMPEKAGVGRKSGVLALWSVGELAPIRP